jgi:lysophospholipid acyltransferase (LPLAT)-like uncharacterized protein
VRSVATMRVDTVPLPLRPAHELGSRVAARLARRWMRGLRERIEVSFEGNTAALEADANVVLAIWHEALVLYFSIFADHMDNHVWMNHPAWFMRPVHVMLDKMGITFVLGSTGHGGRAAAEQVVEALRAGASTTVAVDGPAGPLREIKGGCFHMAAQAGVGLVPIAFSVDRSTRMLTWDRKIVPRRGARVVVHVGEPIEVTDPDDPALRTLLAERLG